ncbi:MAG: hypothetical protein JWP10_1631 [Nocardioidaceae bacterium]|nr:hypothetical protein [Nocardioidaceae bacterium]
MSVDYCTTEDALAVVDALGVQVRDMGLLSSVIARPATDVFGLEAYVSLHDKAAALIDGANRLHPLDDGNKRLSWILTKLFYRLNGLHLHATADDGEEFVIRVAGEHRALPEIASWLETHTSALPR